MFLKFWSSLKAPSADRRFWKERFRNRMARSSMTVTLSLNLKKSLFSTLADLNSHVILIEDHLIPCEIEQKTLHYHIYIFIYHHL